MDYYSRYCRQFSQCFLLIGVANQRAAYVPKCQRCVWATTLSICIIHLAARVAVDDGMATAMTIGDRSRGQWR